MNASVRDGVLVLVIDNPPVNALSHSVRKALEAELTRAADDTSILSVVIACAGRSFFSGADIKEFGKPIEAPGLLSILAQLDGLKKPVVAAIHGNALGGGLEVALCCHFRIATREARLGLPEVKLGLIPGAGGSQRLPRLVGPIKAVQMIVSGNPISGEQALEEGLVDEVFEGDPALAGLKFALRVLADKRPVLRVRDKEEKISPVKSNRAAFDEAVSALTKRTRGLVAPSTAAEAVGYVLDYPFDQGIGKEREKFLELMNGEQSKAQRYAFFAEREASKVLDIAAGTPEHRCESVAIIGAGTMGGGIAMSFANAGIPVTLIDLSEDNLSRGLGIIRKNYEATAARGGLDATDVARRTGLISGKVGLEHANKADLIIEAVFETMAVKKEVFSKLDSVAKPGAIFASNTSYLNIDEIASVTNRPAEFVGMHFFSPANVMKLCEIVRGAKTSAATLATAVGLARKIAKVPVVVGNCDGFVGNRMLAQRSKQAEKLLFEGALPQQIDAVITKFGLPMGPFAMSDLAGLDISWRSRKDRGIKSEIADALCEAGRLGQKTGKGYYRYEPGSRTPLPDQEVQELITKTLKSLGLKSRVIGDEEILDRMTLPMVNEGARILQEGIASRPSDIDAVWLFGYGWPVYRGGPMYYADTLSLGYVVDRLAHYAKQTGEATLEPAPLLKRLADEGASFSSLRKAA